ncbi:calcium/proton exchanger [Athelia psychrophila]|uniref:Vacuolar calcium ion transporter n=1 Tax=Athelia psychrophila TaxID=1759441 RepID=A0A166W444_9AGAM|nr:calcium/proton exchanger [Fibularhizoctonia sp. CBS 109695]
MADTGTSMESSVETRSPMIHHQDEPGGDPLNRPRTESAELQRPDARPLSFTADPSNPTLSGVLHYPPSATTSQPEPALKPAHSPMQATKSIILSSWLNVLLVCIPVSWALHFAKQDDTIVFVFSFLAILPLAKLLAFATEELSKMVGQTLAGLLNATAGNAVELIVSIIALTQGQLHTVQSSLVGSILNNLLLVLGSCFFAGGMRFSEQGLGQSSSQLNASLLTLCVFAVVLPGAYHRAMADILNTQNLDASLSSSDPKEGTQILQISHPIAIILFLVYGYYVSFLFLHKDMYDREATLAVRIKKAQKEDLSHVPELAPTLVDDVENDAASPAKPNQPKERKMGLYMSIGLLVFITPLVAVTAKFLVESIDGLTASGAISKEFVHVILLPILGNAAELIMTVIVSAKDDLILALNAAVGSSIQTALFVIPSLVTLAWIIGKPLTLLFDPLESGVLIIAVLTVNYTLQDGKSNSLEGIILICLYLIIAVVFWFYPGSDPSVALEVGVACYGRSAA